ncbi:MAG: SagB/ThcOx family dehydrogenase [Chloroflexi bacterium]|nr:SagB/ThcOx family dehydrogenase [Chloroflexota bacterium]
MGRKLVLAVVVIVLAILGVMAVMRFKRPSPGEPGRPGEAGDLVLLPEPHVMGKISLEEALSARRSIRDYADDPLSLAELAQLLWAAQGITDPRGYRTAPSAGATYPLELYVVVGRVEGLAAGIYHYLPDGHALARVASGDRRAALAGVALGQSWIEEAPVDLVLAAVYERTMQRYGARGRQYVHMEAGHAAQNVYLQAVTLNLGTVVVGAFHDEGVRDVLGLPKEQQPLYIMPVGHLP